MNLYRIAGKLYSPSVKERDELENYIKDEWTPSMEAAERMCRQESKRALDPNFRALAFSEFLREWAEKNWTAEDAA